MIILSDISRRRAGFTLVELLVVITIIGMLVALLLPAVSAVRENARRGQCANNIRNVAQAMLTYDSSKGHLPGYSQPLRQSATRAVGIKRLADPPRWALGSVELLQAGPISWATMLLPNIERQDIWDRILDVNFETEIRPIALYICPSDSDATAVRDVPALTYSVNAGAPDWDGRFLIEPSNSTIGDTTDNGIVFNVYEYAAKKMKAPNAHLGKIHDGAATTVLLSENVNKSYEPYEPGYPPRFSWAFGTEQHLGINWVVSNPPQPGDGFENQERINHVGADVYDKDPIFDPNVPRFARPASNHGSGVNVAFCDSHLEFMRDDIDYVVYQQLLTVNGKKCVDPRDHSAGVKPPMSGHPIYVFRNAPPLSEQDY